MFENHLWSWKFENLEKIKNSFAIIYTVYPYGRQILMFFTFVTLEYFFDKSFLGTDKFVIYQKFCFKRNYNTFQKG